VTWSPSRYPFPGPWPKSGVCLMDAVTVGRPPCLGRLRFHRGPARHRPVFRCIRRRSMRSSPWSCFFSSSGSWIASDGGGRCYCGSWQSTAWLAQPPTCSGGTPIGTSTSGRLRSRRLRLWPERLSLLSCSCCGHGATRLRKKLSGRDLIRDSRPWSPASRRPLAAGVVLTSIKPRATWRWPGKCIQRTCLFPMPPWAPRALYSAAAPRGSYTRLDSGLCDKR